MIIVFGLSIFLAAEIFYAIIYFRYRKQWFKIKAIPQANIILIPGAGLDPDNSPSDILKDRLLSAIKYQEIYQVSKIILSGASRGKGYDETIVMKEFLLDKNVSSDLIECDPSGFSTFHSLANFASSYSKENFIFISQQFHLARACFLADRLGLNCVGLIADNISFSLLNRSYWYFREIIATPYNIYKIIISKLR